MGNIIPKAVVMSPDQRHHYGSISYKAMKEKSNLSKLSKTAKDAVKEQKTTDVKEKMMSWPTAEMNGRAFTGKFIALKDGKLMLMLSKGAEHHLTKDKVSPAAWAFAEKLQAEKDGVKSPAPSAEGNREFPMEMWKNTKGHRVEAAFVSLIGDKITLKLKKGSLSTFSVSLLSEAGIARAKKYAEQAK
eukprot:Seg14856.1 transcript_id=Seg14856.1/GoldUCD/mRNA.D3Y31 product="hypothetical protein" protein_id=Seg14856.1/GoldUCD/D3Y31